MESRLGSLFFHFDLRDRAFLSRAEGRGITIVRLANSKARIKPTAPLSVFDKENSIEFPLDLVHYIYMQSNPNPVSRTEFQRKEI